MGIEIEYIFLALGVFMGLCIRRIIDQNQEVTGVVQIDHETGLCRFQIVRETLSNPKCKKVIFYVDHNAKVNDDITTSANL